MLLILLLFLLFGHRAFEGLLMLLQLRHLKAARGLRPAAYDGILDDAAYARALDYSRDKAGLALAGTAVEAVAVAALILAIQLGLLGRLAEAVAAPLGNGAWGLALLVLLPLLALSLAGLPLDWWRQFRVEERHGFNKSTPGLWASDQLKSLLLAFLLGWLVLAGLLGLGRALGQGWWLWGFGFLALVQVTLMLAWPRFILPLFNKLEPLPDGELKARLLALAARLDFGVAGLHVMDGSRRSAHANAFFTGFGRFRKVVLFDTLVGQLEPAETEAVLAHEIGHYQKGHTLKGLALSLGSTLLACAAAAWLQGRVQAETGWDSLTSLAYALLSLALLGPGALYWLAPLSMALSRRWEYEADACAVAACGAAPQASALKKTSAKSLGNPAPHPWVVAFHYSHPPLIDRLKALG